MRHIRFVCVTWAILCCGGCFGSAPGCADAPVKQTISDLLRRQLKLTPYARFIDLSKAELHLDAVFTIQAKPDSTACVAFAKFDAQLTDEGRRVDKDNRLLYNVLSELGSEKQVYYSVRLRADGQVDVHVERVGG